MYFSKEIVLSWLLVVEFVLFCFCCVTDETLHKPQDSYVIRQDEAKEKNCRKGSQSSDAVNFCACFTDLSHESDKGEVPLGTAVPELSHQQTPRLVTIATWRWYREKSGSCMKLLFPSTTYQLLKVSW